MHIVFSIDNPFDVRVMKLFLKYIDNSMVLRHTQGKIKPLVGSYKGQIEPSFICSLDDYLKVILRSGYVDNQESVLVVSKNPNGVNSCWFEKPNLQCEEEVERKRLVVVPKEQALKSEGWTYDPETQEYWVVV